MKNPVHNTGYELVMYKGIGTFQWSSFKHGRFSVLIPMTSNKYTMIWATDCHSYVQVCLFQCIQHI
jgi:hypothetical protein